MAEKRRAKSWTLDWVAGMGLCSLKADEVGGEDENDVGFDLCGEGTKAKQHFWFKISFKQEHAEKAKLISRGKCILT